MIQVGDIIVSAECITQKFCCDLADCHGICCVEGEAGAGLVKVTMTCHYGVKRINIDPSLLADAADDKEMLEDLIAAAVNDAVRKAEATTQESMSKYTQGMNLPAGMGDFFK